MTGARRLHRELNDLRNSPSKIFRDIQVDEQNLLLWHGLIVPENPPYNKGAFRVEFTFPAEYPFKPPRVMFRTKIYHPNVDDHGRVCLSLIQSDKWKPTTKTEHIIQALAALVNEPEPEHPLKNDLAEEYTRDKKKFMKNAEEHTRRYAEKRPPD